MKAVTLTIEVYFLKLLLSWHGMTLYFQIILQNSPRNATYTSMGIQNELIATLYRNLIEELRKELDAATSFSVHVLMDEASDFGHHEKCPLCCDTLTLNM